VRRRDRRAALLLAPAALALAAAGCRGRAGALPDRTLTIAVPADITGIFPNPPITNESHTLDIISNVFEGLFALDHNLVPQPALAVRWENPDAFTWVFHLRPGVRFSDGSPLTAADVVSSLRAARDRQWCNAGALPSIEGLEALDALTVRIRTREPNPNLLSRLHYGYVLPVSEIARAPVAPIGTGPYLLGRWTPGKDLLLVRNGNFRGPPAHFERVRIEVVPDERERVGRLESGRAQIATAIPLEEIDRLRQSPVVRVLVAPGLRVVFLGFRVDAPPFSDARVREAVDLAIDREELIRRALHGKALVVGQLVTPTVFGYAASIRAPRTDRERSRHLLREAGFATGIDVRLDGPNNRYVADVAILREVARQLALVGIRVRVNALPKGEWIALLEARRSSFYLFGWSCETRDAGDALDALVHSPTPEGKGVNNYEGLTDPELDALIDEADRPSDAFSRSQLFGRALARVAELRAVVPLEIQPETMAVRTSVAWEPPLDFGLRLLSSAR
jgi:peptide/nickel transport system substrate-binding protein